MNKKLVKREKVNIFVGTFKPIMKDQLVSGNTIPRQESIQPVMSHAERHERAHCEKEKAARSK